MESGKYDDEIVEIIIDHVTEGSSVESNEL